MSVEGKSRPKFDPLAKRAWTDLWPRFLSAVVLIAIAIIAVWVGGYVFAALAAAAFAGCYREWDQMVTLKPLSLIGWLLVALLALAGLSYPAFGFWGVLMPFALATMMVLFVGGTSSVWRVAGIAFFALVLWAALTIRSDASAGALGCAFIAIVIWATDTAAFFTGRQVGGEKMAPGISPSKTWSGAAGGLALGTIGGTIFWIFATPSPWWIGVLLAAGMSIVGQVGDLTESAIKRRFRVKDSGDIIPGHGGLMDRLDSLTFGVLFLLLVGWLHGGGDIASSFLHWT